VRPDGGGGRFATLDARSLRARIAGEVVLPGDPRWDAARQPWNLAIEQAPAAVAYPRTSEEVVAVVAFAQEHGLRIAPQGLGHGAHTLAPLADAILLRTSALTRVEIDVAARIARVQAGAPWESVLSPAGASGLAALAGTAPDLNVVGYTLGGGIGWLARRFGLACNSVRAAEVVTRESELVRADARNEPDLFWALRGGGGSFGVVTELELELYPVDAVYAGAAFWPGEAATELLELFGTWVQHVPDELTSLARFVQAPALPIIPEPLHERFTVGIEACFLGPEDEGVELLAPFRELGPPLLDTFALMQPQNLGALHMDPPVPVPGLGHHVLLEELPPAAAAALVAAAGPQSGSPLVSIEIRHLGGALAQPAAEHGALAALEAAFAVFALGMPGGLDEHPELRRWLQTAIGALEPWSSPRGYLNFAEQPTDARTLFPEDVYRRLRSVKRAYDPHGTFLANHPIEPDG
jgi:hypothetical protein